MPTGNNNLTSGTSLVTLSILSYYDGKIKEWTEDQIDDGVANSLKSAAYSGNTLNLYKTDDASGTPAYSFNLPEEFFLDQTKTTFVETFAWSAETYPGSTNPNLDGKPVMVLAVKGDSSVTYSFLNMEVLVDTYTGVDTNSVDMTVSGYEVKADVKVSAKTGNIISIQTGEGEEGIYAAHQDISGKADKVTSATAGNFAGLDANGNLTDSGSKAADFVAKTTTIAGVDLQDNVTKEELLTALNVEDGAQVNIIETVQVNGTALDVASKTVNVTVATGSTNGTVAVNGADVAVKGYSDLEATVGDSTKGLVKGVADNVAAISKLNGADTEEGSVAYAVKGLADGAVKTNTDAITTLNGADSVEGSVDYKIKAYKDSIVYTTNDDIDALFAAE